MVILGVFCGMVLANLSLKILFLFFFFNLAKVSWSQFIWHKKHALRYSCYSWMAILRRLKCDDILIRRSIPISPLCSFCQDAPESHRHLFFECDFSFMVITSILTFFNSFLFRPTLCQIFVYWLLIALSISCGDKGTILGLGIWGLIPLPYFMRLNELSFLGSKGERTMMRLRDNLIPSTEASGPLNLESCYCLLNLGLLPELLFWETMMINAN